MVRVWNSYQTDLGRAYPLYAQTSTQVNDTDSSIDPVLLLPNEVSSTLSEQNNSCGVPGLTARVLVLWTSDGAQWQLNYPVPFSESLAAALTQNLEVTAFEFVGERIKDGRLRRMLPNV